MVAEILVVAALVLNGHTLNHFGSFSFSVSPSRGSRRPELDNLAVLAGIGRSRDFWKGQVDILEEQTETVQEKPGVLLWLGIAITCKVRAPVSMKSPAKLRLIGGCR